jgi:hypothetical protein
LGGLFDSIDRFRVFDPGTSYLAFWAQEFTVQELVNEVQRLLPKLEEEEEEVNLTR